ncbi:c-type cytochrome [Azospira oryzae]|uniref:c-type cytochrome n=1 Tax=Azospira oryzae TaxID=146939 RepID=UPI001966280B|nr:cytochrome C [Azospira oryzae]
MPFARHPMSRLSLLAVLAAGLGSSAAFAADPNLGRNLAATCANCHGTDGHAQPGAMDVLAGQDKGVLLQKLNGFRDGSRPATIMHQIAKGYTPEQLDLITTYLAAQKREGK